MLTVQACIKLEDDFREVDPAKLAMVYEMVSHIHSIVTKLTQILLRRHEHTPT